MGLQSALTTALTGLQASETSIDVIGNNIANSNTVGFKQSDVIFATQFLQTLSIGSAPSDSTGGTNPRQIGLGVKVAQISPDFSQGTIEISSNPLDLAIQGDGFLVVQGGQGQQLFTRNGQLSLNSQNEVVNSTGNKLMGYTVNDTFELQTASPVPLTIPLGAERVAQSTTSATLAGVLNPTVPIAALPGVTESEVMGDASIEFPDDADFTSADITTKTAPDPVGSAVATDTGSATALGVGTYQYRVAFRDANGAETTASSPVSITVGANDRIDLSSLPVETAPTDYVDRVIYRTEVDGTTFYEHSVQTGTSTATINDTVADATLITGAALDPNAIDAGNYRYHVTFFSSAGGGLETRPSVELGTYSLTDSSSGIRLDFSDLNTPDDPQFTQMKIYRTLSTDEDNFYLVDTIPAPGAPGYLDSYFDNTPSSTLVSADTLDLDGPKITAATLLTDVQVRDGSGSSTTYTTPFVEGTLTFGATQGGASLEDQEFAITTTTTVGDLMTFMTDAMGLHETTGVPEFPLPTGGGSISLNNGVLRVTSNFGEENEIAIPLTAFQVTPATSTVPQPVSITFASTQTADGPGTSTEFLVYDSLGAPIRVRVTTVLENSDSNSTTYRWYANSADSNPTPPDQTIVTGNGVLVFDNQGDLLSSPNARISVQRELTASESPLEVALDFGSVTALAETNAAGEATSSLSVTSQDGFPPGVLTDFIVTETGLIQGQFSNGAQRVLGQVIMAKFSNNRGLEQIGDSLFTASVNSGEAQLGVPGEDGIGSLTAGAVELSNTDIGQDLVQMILAQTQYQAGSRVIAATQELLDELLSLQR